MIRSDWKSYSFSFTPLVDTKITLNLTGWRGEKTAYDDVSATGCTIVNGGFESSGGWDDVTVDPEMSKHGLILPPYGILEATTLERVVATSGSKVALANAYLVVSQREIAVKKGVSVRISLKARPYVPGL